MTCHTMSPQVAFYGRMPTEDQQDPRQSLLRQLGDCKTAIPESWMIVALFYDVESISRVSR